MSSDFGNSANMLRGLTKYDFVQIMPTAKTCVNAFLQLPSFFVSKSLNLIFVPLFLTSLVSFVQQPSKLRDCYIKVLLLLL